MVCLSSCRLHRWKRGPLEAISLFVQPKPAISTAVEGLIAAKALRFSRIELDAQDHLFREGDDVRTTFYITRGLIRLYSTSPDGYQKTVFFHKAKTLIGFQAFQGKRGGNPSILNAQATTRCEGYAIDSQEFGDYLRDHGDVCYAVAQYFFEMMSLQTREAVNASTYPILQRFAALLMTLAYEQAPAFIPFGNKELASMLGVHTNSITNSISALRKAGCVERRHGSLVVTDFKELKRFAENLVLPKGN